jgi:3-hydroxybutyryl-CoA dehydrogenase
MADRTDTLDHALPTDKAVVVIGAGTMGSGIAEVAACAGHAVYLRDTSPAALDRGMTQIRRSLDKRVERGRLGAAERDAIFARLRPVDADAKLDNAGLVIEVIVENLDVKVAVLGQIESQVGPDTIIATNTSSLSVTAIAGRLARPERVVGMHFFNPATVLPLVEVISGAATALEVTQTIFETAKAWGKVPVSCRSTPGFIVNRVARPYYGEALRLLQEQAATPATLDAVMRECGGFRMGPCELMDLIGHDVNFAVTKSVCAGFFDDPRYKPSLVQKDLVDAGWLGRKSGRGFFDYREGVAPAAADEASPQGNAPALVHIEGDLGPAAALGGLLSGRNDFAVEFSEGAGLLRVDGFALVLSDGRTATERSLALGEPLVLFDLALDYGACARIALAAAAQATDEHVAKAIGLFARLGKKVSLLADVPGMAVTRTVAMLVNEAADAVQQGIASADDVDAAMQKGVNYPIGPMAWGRQIGLGHVAKVLRHLAQAYGEDRYRTSLWLQRAVHAAQPLGVGHG